MIDKQHNFDFKLNNWYQKYRRDLPWRQSKNPYHIWLSEIILQQTRVAQGMAYYEKFIKHYPTVKDLALAPEQEVLKDWQGLGYYSRARNLHASAQYIHRELKGVFPSKYTELLKLKGVGEYTAAAIASFAYDLPHAVLDGNVFRFLARYYGLELPIDTGPGKKAFQKLADDLLNTKEPAMHNQAMMEFGALQCLPKKPACDSCPFVSSCTAFAEKKIEILPYKKGKTKVRERQMNYLILAHEDQVLLNHRNQKGIWQNLYDFPLIESETKLSSNEIEKAPLFQKLTSNGFSREYESSEWIHLLSHRRLKVQFLELRLGEKPKNIPDNWTWVPRNLFEEYPVPKLIENYVREESKLLSLTKHNTQ